MITLRAINQLAGAYRGASQARALAYLEFAQEHFLDWLRVNGLFEDELAFKGGTSIRKFALGMKGRFSTDLDFASRSDNGAGYVLDELAKGFEHEGVRFTLHGKTEVEAHERHAMWVATALTDSLGDTIPAKLDFALHELVLPVAQKARAPIIGVDAGTLGFVPVSAPLVDLRENLAEKLARARRILLARDVYDLGTLAPSMRNEGPVVHEIVYLKVYGDVVLSGRGTAPFTGGLEYAGWKPAQVLGIDDLGVLVQPDIDWQVMLTIIRDVYGVAIGRPETATEEWLARCSSSDRGRYGQALAEVRARHAALVTIDSR